MKQRRIKLVIEYDGTDFSGFQLQGQGERTVQGVLQRTLSKLTGKFVIVHAAGRTDTGVHARGQVTHFDSDWGVPIDKMALVLNGVLPRDVSVRSSEEVASEFHARFSARQRTYVYTMWLMPQRSAIWCRYAMHEPKALDLAGMREAAELLKGRRDFSAFANASEISPSSMVRDLRHFEVTKVAAGKLILFRLTADGFLRSMVRNLVGGLRSVGLGDIAPDQLYDIAERADRTKNPCPTAAAAGLCLWRVDY